MLTNARAIEKVIAKNEPYCMINRNLVFEFRDKEKTESEIAQLAMFIAMRSILGQKLHCKTNKQLIVSRMFGYKDAKHAGTCMNIAIREFIRKYLNRYHFDKIKEELELNWHIVTYSNHIRGLYISIKQDTDHNRLALVAETNKKKHKLNALRAKKKEAKEQALKQLQKPDDNALKHPDKPDEGPVSF